MTTTKKGLTTTKKGFTLIELIVVLAILAIIMAIAVPTAFGAIDSARQSADRGSLDGFNGAVRMRSIFVLSDNSATVDKTIGKAFQDSGISKTSKPQSTIKIKWVPPSPAVTGTTPKDAVVSGYFEEVPADVTGGTALIPSGLSYYEQLLAIAGTAATPIV